MKKEEFEKQYAKSSKLSIEELRELGLVATECVDCDYDKCEGWQMATQKI